jgi:hypothetical protein
MSRAANHRVRFGLLGPLGAAGLRRMLGLLSIAGLRRMLGLLGILALLGTVGPLGTAGLLGSVGPLGFSSASAQTVNASDPADYHRAQVEMHQARIDAHGLHWSAGMTSLTALEPEQLEHLLGLRLPE